MRSRSRLGSFGALGSRLGNRWQSSRPIKQSWRRQIASAVAPASWSATTATRRWRRGRAGASFGGYRVQPAARPTDGHGIRTESVGDRGAGRRSQPTGLWASRLLPEVDGASGVVGHAPIVADGDGVVCAGRHATGQLRNHRVPPAELRPQFGPGGRAGGRAPSAFSRRCRGERSDGVQQLDNLRRRERCHRRRAREHLEVRTTNASAGGPGRPGFDDPNAGNEAGSHRTPGDQVRLGARGTRRRTATPATSTPAQAAMTLNGSVTPREMQPASPSTLMARGHRR